MHYILGKEFTIPNVQQQVVQPQTGATQLSRPAGQYIAREWADFTPGHSYNLYNIQKNNDGIVYTFRSYSGERDVVKMFESASDADGYISRVKGEQLPDYDSFYENRND